MGGRPGFIVLTPLQLADGSAVIVQRGWLPRHATDRTRIAPYATPMEPVRVVGRIAPPPGRLYEFDAAASGPIRQNVDLADFARESRLALHPLSVQQIDDGGAAADGLLRRWPVVAADVHKNYGYAAQWFAALRGFDPERLPLYDSGEREIILTRNAETFGAQRLLLEDISPIDDIRSSAAYRRRVAANLLEQFWKETAGIRR